MPIAIMRITYLRQADLNLLIVFTVLAEERNVTRAAKRLLLSQPAVSRALQRLRDMFHDDLLIRTSSGYQPTPKGERLLHELESTLPRLDRLLSGNDFDPAAEETSFQIAARAHAGGPGLFSFHTAARRDVRSDGKGQNRPGAECRRRLPSRAPGKRGHL